MDEPTGAIAIEQMRPYVDRGLRIGITGPAGSGKTTFTRYLQSACGAAVHSDTARRWLQDNAPGPHWQLPPNLQAQLQLHLLTELERSSACVFDRFTLDCLFYARPAREELDWPSFQQRCLDFAASLDLILFFPFFAKYLVADGVRNPDPRYQLRTAGFIFALIDADQRLAERTVIFDHTRDAASNVLGIVDKLAALRAAPLD